MHWAKIDAPLIYYKYILMKEMNITLTEIDQLSLEDFNLLLNIIWFRNERDLIENKRNEQRKKTKSII